MESETAGRPSRSTDARSSLQALAADRRLLADRSRAPRWYYPVLALAMAAIVLAPAVVVPWGFPLIGAATLAIILAERGHRQQTKVSTNRIAGPRSLLAALGMGLVVLAALVASLVLALSGQGAQVPVPVAAGFLAMFPGGLAYDRAYAADVRRGA